MWLCTLDEKLYEGIMKAGACLIDQKDEFHGLIWVFDFLRFRVYGRSFCSKKWMSDFLRIRVYVELFMLTILMDIFIDKWVFKPLLMLAMVCARISHIGLNLLNGRFKFLRAAFQYSSFLDSKSSIIALFMGYLKQFEIVLLFVLRNP